MTVELDSHHQGEALEYCLLAVLAWHEQRLSLASLRSRGSADGPMDEAQLTEAADSLGYDVSVERVQPGALPPMPAICRKTDGSALALLADAGDGNVYLADLQQEGKPVLHPASEVARQISNSAICLARRVLPPVAGHDKEMPHGVGRHGHWFWGPMLRARWVYVQVALAALLVNVFAISSSVFSMIVYDRVIPNNATDTLIALLVGIAIIFFSDFAIRSVRGYFLDLASARADGAIADALFGQILDARLQAQRASTGSMASMLKEFESIRDFLTSATLTTFIDLPFALLFLVMIWLIGGPMIWIPLIAIPVMLVSGLAVQPKLKKLVKAAQEDGHHKHAILVETLSGLETIKSLGAGALMRRRWQEAVSHQSRVGLQSRQLAQLASNMANLAQQFVQVGVIAAGAFLVRDGLLGFGAIIACTILAGRAIAPMAQVTQLLTRLNQTITSYRTLNDFMKQSREHQVGQQFMSRPVQRGTIEFRNVTFTYPGAERPTLENVSFQISAGDKVAIVGRVGSGKTTVSKLILGLYAPDSGAVLIDGVDVRQIDPADLRRAVGVVLQEVWLIGGTVRQNIALGGDHPTDAEILRAAQVAGVDDFIRQHPQGYGLRLGERGEGLSGGQRQAIAIARALLRHPPILLFDEATSAMDINAESALLQKLTQEIGQRTFVTITHKASLLQVVNKVIVIEQGKVAAQGSPEQLMKAQQTTPRATQETRP